MGYVWGRMTTIKERIQELKEFQQIVWDKYSDDWFEVPHKLFNKYGLDSDKMSDQYYFGCALDMIIEELEKFSEAEDK